MELLEKAAEILVECGYATNGVGDSDGVEPAVKVDGKWIYVDEFADTLESRRQADAIEDWLIDAESILWIESKYRCKGEMEDGKARQWRLDRIKWCLERLNEAA